MKYRVLNRVDPPLSNKGLEQAKATGEFLITYLLGNGYEFDEVIVECSPSMRCMMTAGQIAACFGWDKVTINYRACEVLKSQTKESPLADLEWTKNEFDFNVMQSSSSRYSSGEFFPKSVYFEEAADGKEEKT